MVGLAVSKKESRLNLASNISNGDYPKILTHFKDRLYNLPHLPNQSALYLKIFADKQRERIINSINGKLGYEKKNLDLSLREITAIAIRDLNRNGYNKPLKDESWRKVFINKVRILRKKYSKPVTENKVNYETEVITNQKQLIEPIKNSFTEEIDYLYERKIWRQTREDQARKKELNKILHVSFKKLQEKNLKKEIYKRVEEEYNNYELFLKRPYPNWSEIVEERTLSEKAINSKSNQIGIEFIDESKFKPKKNITESFTIREKPYELNYKKDLMRIVKGFCEKEKLDSYISEKPLEIILEKEIESSMLKEFGKEIFTTMNEVANYDVIPLLKSLYKKIKQENLIYTLKTTKDNLSQIINEELKKIGETIFNLLKKFTVPIYLTSSLLTWFTPINEMGESLGSFEYLKKLYSKANSQQIQASNSEENFPAVKSEKSEIESNILNKETTPKITKKDESIRKIETYLSYYPTAYLIKNPDLDLIDKIISLSVHYSDMRKLNRIEVIGTMNQESGFYPKATSVDGAMGIMQIMPKTAKWIVKVRSQERRLKHLTDLYELDLNIDLGTWYLTYIRDNFSSNFSSMLVGYNSGPGRIRKNGKLPNIDETKDFVRKVNLNVEEIKNIYNQLELEEILIKHLNDMGDGLVEPPEFDLSSNMLLSMYPRAVLSHTLLTKWLDRHDGLLDDNIWRIEDKFKEFGGLIKKDSGKVDHPTFKHLLSWPGNIVFLLDANSPHLEKAAKMKSTITNRGISLGTDNKTGEPLILIPRYKEIAGDIVLTGIIMTPEEMEENYIYTKEVGLLLHTHRQAFGDMIRDNKSLALK